MPALASLESPLKQHGRLRSMAWVMLMICLPIIEAVIQSYFYSVFPLYIKATDGMSLAELGFGITGGTLIRVLLSLLLRKRASSRFALRMAAIGPITTTVAVSVAMLIWPTPLLVILSTVVIVASSQRGVQQLLVPKLAGTGGAAKAARVWEGSYTMGYCIGAFLGGLVYDFGPWGPQRIENCAVLQFVLCLVSLVMAMFVSWVVNAQPSPVDDVSKGEDSQVRHTDTKLSSDGVNLPLHRTNGWVAESEPADVNSVLATDQDVHKDSSTDWGYITVGPGAVECDDSLPERATVLVLVQESDDVGASPLSSIGTDPPTPTPIEQGDPSGEQLSSAEVEDPPTEQSATGAILQWGWLIGGVASVAVGLINFGYIIEWMLYAIVMSEKFGWSATAAGAGQMSGDFGGAITLFVLARFNSKRRLPLSLRMPLNNGILIGLLGAMLMMMASPELAWCALGQVGMGTAYILSMQIGSEMALIYSLGDPAALNHHIATNFVSFNVGLMIATSITLPLYEQFGEQVPLLGGGLLLLAGALLWTIIFIRRGGLKLGPEETWFNFERDAFLGWASHHGLNLKLPGTGSELDDTEAVASDRIKQHTFIGLSLL